MGCQSLILLDTHVLVWYAQGEPRLGSHTRTIVDRALAERSAFVSAISLWELAMLVEKRRIGLSLPLEKWFRSLLKIRGFDLAPLEARVALEAGRLPEPLHGDPADRIIIATARVHGCAVATRDCKILAYAADGHVQAIDAHR